MRAAVITAPGEVEVTSLDDPTPQPGEVVVEVASVGICGTDLHLLHGQLGYDLPLVPGHEFAGEVVAVGADVASLRVGDRVAVDPNLPCNACRECARGRSNLCLDYDALGVTRAGAAAQYVTAPAGRAVVLPDELDTRDAALVEPLSCAVRAFDVVSARLGDRVLVYGAGTMGVMNTALALRAGAATVDVVDPNIDRLDAAARAGARRTAATADEFEEVGWDVVIDCSGAIAAIEDGLTRVARGGTFLQFGVAPVEARATWSPYRVYRDEITIVGSMAVLHSFDRAVRLLAAGAVDAGLLVSDRVPLETYPEAIAAFERGEGRKIHVLPKDIS